MSRATEHLVGNREPAWEEYYNQRLPGETPHPDDQFFNGAIGGTAVNPAGSVTWTQANGLLSWLGNTTGLNASNARVYPLTPSAAPVTMETHFFEGVVVGNQVPGFLMGFSDGAADGSALAGLLYSSAGYTANRGTFQTANFALGTAGLTQPITDRYFRVCWASTDTFTFASSQDGVSYSKHGTTTFARTLTPTHFWVAAQQNNAADAIVAWDYIRIYEADLVG